MQEAQLIRFALGPDSVVVPDVAAKLPGRGAWVRADRASVAQAAKKGAFSRAFKQPVKTGDDLPAFTETLLAKRCLDLLEVLGLDVEPRRLTGVRLAHVVGAFHGGPRAEWQARRPLSLANVGSCRDEGVTPCVPLDRKGRFRPFRLHPSHERSP